MSTKPKTRNVLTAKPRWPDVHRNYGRIAIPAVVAAVIADKSKRNTAGKRIAERRQRDGR